MLWSWIKPMATHIHKNTSTQKQTHARRHANRLTRTHVKTHTHNHTYTHTCTHIYDHYLRERMRALRGIPGRNSLWTSTREPTKYVGSAYSAYSACCQARQQYSIGVTILVALPVPLHMRSTSFEPQIVLYSVCWSGVSLQHTTWIVFGGRCACSSSLVRRRIKLFAIAYMLHELAVSPPSHIARPTLALDFITRIAFH